MDIIRARNSQKNTENLPFISIVVKEERVRLGFTQLELSHILRIGLKTIRKIEQGDLNVNFNKLNFLLISLGFHLTVDQLVTSPVAKTSRVIAKKDIMDMLEMILPILSRKYGIQRLSLFGSYAKDFQTEKSDIDLLVSFEKPPTLALEGEVQIVLENLLFGKKVDLTQFNNLKPELKSEIMESKIDIKGKLQNS